MLPRLCIPDRQAWRGARRERVSRASAPRPAASLAWLRRCRAPGEPGRTTGGELAGAARAPSSRHVAAPRVRGGVSSSFASPSRRCASCVRPARRQRLAGLGSKQRAQQQGIHAHEAVAWLFTHLPSARVRKARFPCIHWALVRCRWAVRWHSHPDHALRSVRRRAPLQPRCRRRPRRSRRAAPRRPRRRPGAAPAAPPPLPPAPRRAGSSRPRPWRLYQTAVFWKR